MCSAQNLQACAMCPLYTGQAERPAPWDTGDKRLLWIGLPGKPGQKRPLAEDTLSGSMVARIEQAAGISGSKTNLVRCAPLDGNGKLRYPTKKEMSTCAKHLAEYIKTMQPKAVILLGERAGETAGQALGVPIREWDGYHYQPTFHNGTWFVMVHHPSYKDKRENPSALALG